MFDASAGADTDSAVVDASAVVDGDCKSMGIEGVRVVDASILPKPLAAGTLAPTSGNEVETLHQYSYVITTN